MPFNLLILPLLGGYIFVTMCWRTRFETLRADGQRLIIKAAFSGVLLLLIASMLRAIAIAYQSSWPEWFSRSVEWFHRVAPYPDASAPLLSLFLAFPGYLIANAII